LESPIEMAGHLYNRAGATAQPVMKNTQSGTQYIHVIVLRLLELLLGAQEDCALTVEEASNYPHCNAKIGVRAALLFHHFTIKLQHIISIGTIS